MSISLQLLLHIVTSLSVVFNRPEDHGECSSNETEWKLNPDIEQCPVQSQLVVGLLAFYTVITNLMLLSLLVAMFTSVEALSLPPSYYCTRV